MHADIQKHIQVGHLAVDAEFYQAKVSTAQFYFDQIAGKSGPVASADDLVSDVSGIEGTIELE